MGPYRGRMLPRSGTRGANSSLALLANQATRTNVQSKIGLTIAYVTEWHREFIVKLMLMERRSRLHLHTEAKHKQ